MKRLTRILAALSMVLALFACKKNPQPVEPGGDNKPSGKTLSASVLTADKAQVTLSDENASTAVLSLSWTSGLGEGDTEPVSYTLYANKTGVDMFTDPVSFSLGKALNKSFTGKELNDICATLGLEGEADVVFAVYAVADKGTYESVLSNRVTVKVLPYKEAFVGPAALYMVGVATPYAWDLSKALALPNDGKNVYKAADVPLTVLPISLNAGFKFYFSRGQNEGDDPRFVGQDPKEDAFGKAIIVEEGDYQFLPAQAGYNNGVYDITVDLNQLLVTIVRKGDLPETPLPDKLYMMGESFSWKWSGWDEATTLDKVSDKVYEAKGVRMAFGDNANPLGFKVFIGKEVWSPYFAMGSDATKEKVTIQKVEDSEAPQFYPGKLGFADGVYDVKMDFSAMVATFTLKEEASGFPEKLYLLGGCFKANWTYSDDLVLEGAGDGTYSGTITFTGMEEWNGFKIYSGPGYQGPWYGMDLDNPVSSGIVLVNGAEYIESTGAVDTQVYLGRLDYTVGTYLITVNLNTMRLTASKQSGGGGTEPALPEVLYLVGGMTGWNFLDDYVLTKGEGKVYTATGLSLDFGDNGDNGFRLHTAKDDWNNVYTYKDGGYDNTGFQLAFHTDGGDPPQILPGSKGFSSGTYNLSFNAETMWLSLTKQ